MTRLFFLLILLTTSPTQSRAYNVPDLIRAAYELGKQDAVDDIGLVRLTIEDVKEILELVKKIKNF